MNKRDVVKGMAVIVELATFYQFDANAMAGSRISVDL